MRLAANWRPKITERQWNDLQRNNEITAGDAKYADAVKLTPTSIEPATNRTEGYQWRADENDSYLGNQSLEWNEC